MTKQVGRNDPCPCGSGKKFKSCCWAKSQPGRKKISAKLLNGKVNLMERAFGSAISSPKPLNEVIKQTPTIGGVQAPHITEESQTDSEEKSS